MRILLRVLSFAVLTTAACAIPARNNEIDPSNSPDVRVRLLDYTLAGPGSVCPAFLGSGTEVSVSSRGNCLAFDASLTTDRDGRLVTGSSYSWALVDDEGGVIEPLDGASATFVLDRPFRMEHPVNQVLRMRTTARDTAGNRGSVVTEFALLNSTPVAIPGPARVVPLDGFPGAPASSVTIALDGSRSFDPDGDLLRLCWSAPGEPETCSDAGDQTPLLVDLDVTKRRRQRFQLIADDTTSRSEPRIESVFVRETPAWIIGPGQLLELDAGISNALVATTAAFASLNDVSSVEGPDSEDYVVGSFGEFSPNQSFVSITKLAKGAAFTTRATFHDSAPFATRIAGHRGSRRFWVMAPALDGQFMQVEVGGDAGALDLTPTTTRFAGSTPLPYDFTDEYVLSTDSTDRLWLAPTRRFASTPADGAGKMYVIADDESMVTLFDNDTVNFLSLSRRPETDEIWAVAIQNDGSSPTLASPGFYVFDTANDSLRVVPAGNAGALSMSFISPDQAWIARADGTLTLIDVALLDSAGIEAAVLRSYPVPGGIDLIEGDPLTGDCYGVGREPETGHATRARVTLDGGISVVAQLSGSAPQAPLGTNGESLHPLGLGIVISRGANATEVVSQIAIPNRLAVTLDRSSGGLTASISVPGALARYSEGGTTSALWTFLQDENGNQFPTPQILRLYGTPDGTAVWAILGDIFTNADSLGTIDFTSSPPTVREVLPPPAFGLVTNLVPIDRDNAWNLRTNELGVIDETGVFTQVLDFDTDNLVPAGNGAMALSLEDDTLCFNARAPVEYRHYRVPHPDAALPPMVVGTASIATPAGGTTRGGAFATSDLCWYWTALRQGANPSPWILRAKAYTTEGTLVRDLSFGLTGVYEPRDVTAAGDESFFVLSSDPQSSTRSIVTLVDAPPAGPAMVRNLTPTTSLDIGHEFAR